MRLDESELPDYLSRAIAAARQKQREMSDDDDDDSEVEDEVGNPNFDPELQEVVFLGLLYLSFGNRCRPQPRQATCFLFT